MSKERIQFVTVRTFSFDFITTFGNTCGLFFIVWARCNPLVWSH